MLRTAGTEQVIFATLERLVDYTTPFLARKASFTESALTHIIEGKDCLETLDNLLSKRSLLNTTSNHETKHRTDEKAAATIGGAWGHTEAVRRQTCWPKRFQEEKISLNYNPN